LQTGATPELLRRISNMKNRIQETDPMMTRNVLFSTLALLAAASTALAQFDSGSDGSYGPIDVTSGTVSLEMPPDGIFHATTVNVASGATLKFNRNARNTPVYLLATGDITVAGTIDGSGANGTSVPPAGGKGGPGGFDGGTPGYGSVSPGGGKGPGGAGATPLNVAGGRGAYRTRTGGDAPVASDGMTYGSPLLVPMVGGSGGGGTTGEPGWGGGGGGGAILLASNTRVHITGVVRANGGWGQFQQIGAGSGGAVRAVAPIVSGSGVVDVLALLNDPSGNRAGQGRVRMDAIDRSQMSLILRPVEAASIGSYMVVFPPSAPRLDVIEAGGTVIAEGGDPALVILPFGTDPEQTVTVQATDFTGEVPITVALIPESGDRIEYDDCIDMGGNSVAQLVVPVTFPINTLTHVQVWTRPATPPCP
jgi:hypothetical protein